MDEIMLERTLSFRIVADIVGSGHLFRPLRLGVMQALQLHHSRNAHTDTHKCTHSNERAHIEHGTKEHRMCVHAACLFILSSKTFEASFFIMTEETEQHYLVQCSECRIFVFISVCLCVYVRFERCKRKNSFIKIIVQAYYVFVWNEWSHEWVQY